MLICDTIKEMSHLSKISISFFLLPFLKTFWCKPCYNWIYDFRVMKDMTMLKIIWNVRNLNTVFANISKTTSRTSDSFLLIMSHILWFIISWQWHKHADAACKRVHTRLFFVCAWASVWAIWLGTGNLELRFANQRATPSPQITRGVVMGVVWIWSFR